MGGKSKSQGKGKGRAGKEIGEEREETDFGRTYGYY